MPKRPLRFQDYSWNKQIRLKRFVMDLSSQTEEKTSEADVFAPSTSADGIIIAEINSANVLNNNSTNANIGSRTLPNAAENNYVHHEDLANDGSSSDKGSTCSIDAQKPESLQKGNLFDQLYPGAPINVAELIMCVTTLILRHKLSKACVSDILKLLSMTCISPNKCPKTFHNFKKSYNDLQTPLKKHFYCSNCLCPVEADQASNQALCVECTNISRSDYFIEISIISQITSLFKRPGFYEKLDHRFNRATVEGYNFRDIYDGEVYREVSQRNKILSNRNNISFTWCTDGVSIFKSSKYNIWPFYLAINELPYRDRFKIENVLLVGLWFGEKKPKPTTFLRPHMPALTVLYHGINVYVPSLKTPITVRGIILDGTCDLPAKALFLNMNQYNGEFGCPKCKEKGIIVDNRRIYPYAQNLNLRTDAETLDHASQAHESKVKVCGVKGPTIMSKMISKCVKTTAVDGMHCIFLGVVDGCLLFWFDPRYSDEPFSIYNLIKVVDERLSSIKPPAYVQRRPRSIEQHSKFWKASELKNWFFYFSLPILHDILPEEYFEHYKLLVLGISLLYQENISTEMVDLADEALREFVARYEELYGLEHMTCNVHQLRHLADTVRNTGPLWTTSCFPFEDLNGKLKALVHGSKSAEIQIFFNISLYINANTLKDEWLVRNSEPYEFCRRLLSTKKNLKLRTISDSLHVVGNVHRLNESPNDVVGTIPYDLSCRKNVHIFKKLFKKNVLYTSKIYQGSKKTESFCVKYLDDGLPFFGFVQYYLRVTDCDCLEFCKCPATYLAVIKKCLTENAFQTNLPNGVLFSIKKYSRETNNPSIIGVEFLECVCFHIRIEDTEEDFIVEPVNMLEKE